MTMIMRMKMMMMMMTIDIILMMIMGAAAGVPLDSGSIVVSNDGSSEGNPALQNYPDQSRVISVYSCKRTLICRNTGVGGVEKVKTKKKRIRIKNKMEDSHLMDSVFVDISYTK